jgi:hypothetical protein
MGVTRWSWVAKTERILVSPSVVAAIEEHFIRFTRCGRTYATKAVVVT